MKLAHIITTLDTGGAEIMLLRLLSRLDPKIFSNFVINLTKTGAIGRRIYSLGIPVYDLGFERGSVSLKGAMLLNRFLRSNTPDIIQTWMYHANILGLLASWRIAGKSKVVWNIQASKRAFYEYKPLTFLMVILGRLFSPFTEAVIVNSRKGIQDHLKMGYRSNKMIFIPNGFDMNIYQPNQRSRFEIRKRLSIEDDAPCVGLFARFHPVKDHFSFLKAAWQVHQWGVPAHFLLCGEGVDEYNPQLKGWLEEHHLSSFVHLLGRIDDVPRIMAAVDTVVSCSTSEGFSNVIGEAMASGVPCVVTDVGDSSMIIGKTGLVVPPGKPDCLAEAISVVLKMPRPKREALGQSARKRIEAYYSIERVTQQYKALYCSIFKKEGSCF